MGADLEQDLPIYTTADVSEMLGVSVRQARNVCNSIFKAKKKFAHHRLTGRQMRIVQSWHRKIRRT